MELQQAQEEYIQALRAGQKEYKTLLAEGKNPYPLVLDEILEGNSVEIVENLGLVEIPAELIVGTKAAGRISAFSAGFLPLLEQESEFGSKWIHLCRANLTDEGIRDPILCYEYLGKFYVQEGNKRVSVLKYMGAARIPGMVKRIMPREDGSVAVRAYKGHTGNAEALKMNLMADTVTGTGESDAVLFSYGLDISVVICIFKA